MPLSALELQFSKWHKMLSSNQSGNIFALKKSGILPRLLQFAQWHKITHNEALTLLDLDTDSLTDPYTLNVKLDKCKGDVILLARDHFLSQDSLSLEPILQRHYAEGKLNIILVHECTPHQINLSSYHTALLYANHCIYSSPQSPIHLEEYMKNISKLWHLESPKAEMLSHILQFCGNQPWLINEYLRLMAEIPKNDMDLVEKSPSLTNRTLTLIESLPALYHSQLGGRTRNQDIIKEMQSFGLIDHTCQPNGKWLSKSLSTLNSSRMIIDQGKIYYNHIDLTPNFTAKEKLLINFFHPSPQIVSSETLGKTIYGNSSLDYSDWALAQAISRFRVKISQLNLPLKVTTKRGRGYAFSRG